MAFLAKGKKEDLIELASEMGLDVNINMKVVDLKGLITASEHYEVEFVTNLFQTIVEERKKRESLEESVREENFQLQKLRHEVELKQLETGSKTLETVKNSSMDLKNLIHKFDLKEDISLYLVLFERQARRAKIDESTWITHLLGLLPSEITQMIAREPEEKVQTYEQVKELLLKRFKLTPEKFRQLFAKHQKDPEKTWVDFYHELFNYFHGWTSGLKIETFEQLRDLMITDQIKKRAPYEFKEYFLDKWTSIVSPIQLAEKIEEFEDGKKSLKVKTANLSSKYKLDSNSEKVKSQLKKSTKEDDQVKTEEFRSKNTGNYNRDFDRRKTLKCFVCGSTEHLKPQCPKLSKTTPEFVNFVSEPGTKDFLDPFTIKGTINGIQCQIIRDTGSTIDIVPRKYVKSTAMTGERVWIQQPLDFTPICLPIAEIHIESELGNLVTRAAVIPDELDRGRYLLGNRSAAMLENVQRVKAYPEKLSAVKLRRRKLLQRNTNYKCNMVKNVAPESENNSKINDEFAKFSPADGIIIEPDVVSSTAESAVKCLSKESPKTLSVQSGIKLNPNAKPFVMKSVFKSEETNFMNSNFNDNNLSDAPPPCLREEVNANLVSQPNNDIAEETVCSPIVTSNSEKVKFECFISDSDICIEETSSNLNQCLPEKQTFVSELIELQNVEKSETQLENFVKFKEQTLNVHSSAISASVSETEPKFRNEHNIGSTEKNTSETFQVTDSETLLSTDDKVQSVVKEPDEQFIPKSLCSRSEILPKIHLWKILFVLNQFLLILNHFLQVFLNLTGLQRIMIQNLSKSFPRLEKIVDCVRIFWEFKNFFKLHCYLDGKMLTIETDHNQLVWLNSNAGSNQRLMRCTLALQTYHFDMEFNFFLLNTKADIVSRLINLYLGY